MRAPSRISHRVLVIAGSEDAAWIQAQFGSAGGGSWTVEHRPSIPEGLDRIASGGVEAVVLDLSRPGADGTAVRDLCARFVQTPVIALLGDEEPSMGLRLVQEGAQDALPRSRAGGHVLDRVLRFAIERKKAESSLRAALEQAQSVAHLGSWISDPSWEGELRWSAETYRIFGVSEAEFDGQVESFFAFVHPDDREGVREAARASLERGVPYAVDHRIVRLDGSVRWVHERADVERDQEGRPVRMIGTVQDITERVQLEGRLLQFQKIEAIGRLAGGIAHDFNNLLGVMTGLGDLLARDLEPEHRGRPRVAQMREAIDRAASLTRQLLAFSRKQVLQPNVLGLNEVVREMEGILRRLIGEDVQLVTALAPGLGTIRADRSQLEQVLLNLAVNAREAMPRGGELIIETSDVTLDEAYVRMHAGSSAGRHVMLAVSDTGHGMDDETLAHVFEPFFTTKDGRGTGLGLATVYGIVKQSGGYVAVYSEPGRGTTFKVYLPRVDAAREESAPASAGLDPPGGRERVLVVEDERALRDIIHEMLEDAGYEVVESESPVEALALPADTLAQVALVLTDVVLPGLSGPETAARFRHLQPDLKVLYMSGYTDEAIGMQGVLEPGTHFIPKPFTAEALLRKVREVLDAP